MYKNNTKIFKELRKTYKYFIYEDFEIRETDNSLVLRYHFNLDDKYKFYPELKILKKLFFNHIFQIRDLELFVFHIGMIEMVSYWKAACPPQIMINPGYLSNDQVNWWKKLYFFGLGEFFYTNGIEITQNDFVDIQIESDKRFKPAGIVTNPRKVIVPVGGGKDSVVSLELLKNDYEVIPFIVNPRNASINSVKQAGFAEEQVFEVERNIHPQLLKLNDMGFLNGHTPFSALLAFVSVFGAAITGSGHIALSNESSANEPTTQSGVNHQYSKSYGFEKDFRDYLYKNITKDINYFSFLRPLSEYTIAELFSGFASHFDSFRSCNAASKTNSWCGKCPKCLFTYIILSPFLDSGTLDRIFGKNLLDDGSLLVIFNELTGISEEKPFECVGTVDEINLALLKTIEKYEGTLPKLLQYYKSTPLMSKYSSTVYNKAEEMKSENHFLEPDFYQLLKNRVHAG